MKGPRPVIAKVAAAGAVGTAIRLVGVLPLTVAVYGDPLTLLLLNTFGCAVAGMVVATVRPSPLRTALTHGVLGAFTTFSSVIIAAGRIGHGLGLVAEGTSRMTSAGLLLSFGYVAVSVGLGLFAFSATRRLVAR